MSFVEVKQKKGILKKYKKIFCKQFVRIKKKYFLLNQRNMV